MFCGDGEGGGRAFSCRRRSAPVKERRKFSQCTRLTRRTDLQTNKDLQDLQRDVSRARGMGVSPVNKPKIATRLGASGISRVIA